MIKYLFIFIFIPLYSLAQDFKNVEYIKCYDGDTCTFNLVCNDDIFCKKIDIRIKGIDAPELRTQDQCEKAKARQAKEYVNNLVSSSKKVELQDCIRGKYFRLVCNVFTDYGYISNLLLTNNLAVEYDGGTKQKINWCY